MKMMKEFKEFITRGNVVDLSIGVIIGGAFGKITTSLVNDVIMPPVGMLLAKVDFRTLHIPLKHKTVKEVVDGVEREVRKPDVAISYGAFLNTVLDFLIVALVVFLMIKGVNRLRRQPPPPPPSTRECPFCLSAIPIKATRCAHCTSEVKPA